MGILEKRIKQEIVKFSEITCSKLSPQVQPAKQNITQILTHCSISSMLYYLNRGKQVFVYKFIVLFLVTVKLFSSTK